MQIIVNGAPNGIFLKLFDELHSELKQKEDIINSFIAQLKYTSNFNEKIKTKFFSEKSTPAVNKTI